MSGANISIFPPRKDVLYPRVDDVQRLEERCVEHLQHLPGLVAKTIQKESEQKNLAIKCRRSL